MSDSEILDWIEKNSKDYLLVPPDSDEDEWSLYEKGHVFVSRGVSLRECIENFNERKCDAI